MADDEATRIRQTNDEVSVRPVRDEEDLALDELLEGMTPDRVHGEVDWGPPQGGEVW